MVICSSPISGCGARGAGRGAKIRYGPRAGSDIRTNDSAILQSRDAGRALQRRPWPSPVGCSRPPPHPPTQDDPRPVGNPDASRSFAGRASGCSAPRGSRGRASSPDSAGRPRAGSDVGPAAHNRRHSKSVRGRNSCKSAPEPGNGHTETVGRASPPLEARLDCVRNGWNTAPACVLGTVWGTASIPDLAV